MSINRNLLIGIITVLVLVLGLVFIVYQLKQTTNTKQEANQTANINTGPQISTTNNSNGTMGPSTFSKNYSNSLSSQNLGSLTFLVTDPPTPSAVNKGVQKVTSLIPRVNKVEVHLIQTGSGVGSNKVDKWETLYMQYPMSFDLVQLKNGITANLSLTKLSEGKYSEIRVYIERATAVLENRQLVYLQMPDKNWVVAVKQNFTLEKGKNTNLIMDFDAQKSVTFDGKNFLLKPFVSKLSENK